MISKSEGMSKTMKRFHPENAAFSGTVNSLVSNPKMSGFETTISCPHCDYDYLVEPEETQITCNNLECGKKFKIQRVANECDESEERS